jgi:hypothetical protein
MDQYILYKGTYMVDLVQIIQTRVMITTAKKRDNVEGEKAKN